MHWRPRSGTARTLRARSPTSRGRGATRVRLCARAFVTLRRIAAVWGLAVHLFVAFSQTPRVALRWDITALHVV